MATVLPARLPSTLLGIAPDLREVLWEDALRTRAVSSVGVRSAMERKWRGANGEVWGAAALEWLRVEAFDSWWRALPAGRMPVGGISGSVKSQLALQWKE